MSFKALGPVEEEDVVVRAKWLREKARGSTHARPHDADNTQPSAADFGLVASKTLLMEYAFRAGAKEKKKQSGRRCRRERCIDSDVTLDRCGRQSCPPKWVRR